jgi:hypothetical protein
MLATFMHRCLPFTCMHRVDSAWHRDRELRKRRRVLAPDGRARRVTQRCHCHRRNCYKHVTFWVLRAFCWVRDKA